MIILSTIQSLSTKWMRSRTGKLGSKSSKWYIFLEWWFLNFLHFFSQLILTMAELEIIFHKETKCYDERVARITTSTFATVKFQKKSSDTLTINSFLLKFEKKLSHVSFKLCYIFQYQNHCKRTYFMKYLHKIYFRCDRKKIK